MLFEVFISNLAIMKKQLLLSIFLFVLLSSCEEPLCIFPKEPELDNKEFPIGSTESYYYVDLNKF